MLPIEKRIPNNLGGTDMLRIPFIGAVVFSDALVAFAPAMFTLFVLNQVVPAEVGYITLVASGVVGLFGLMFLLAKPDYLSLSEWLQNYRAFRGRPDSVEKTVATDGGVDRHGVPVSAGTDTRELTKVDKIYPREGAVLLEDGSMVGAVECGGVNLDTATGSEWQIYASKFANWFNTQVTYDLQFYMPMRQFDPTTQMDMYFSRLDDDDVADNRILRNYVEDRAAWMQATAAESYVREFYVLFRVNRSEVLTNQFDQGDLERNLKKLPVGDSLEDFIKGLRGTDTSTTLSEREIKDRQLREVNRRQDSVAGGLGLGGKNQVTPVDGDHLGVLLKEYWEGTIVRDDEAENFVRKSPFVTGGNSVADGVTGDNDD
jgi:hypothetical protein